MKVIALVFTVVALGLSSTSMAMDIASSDMRDALSHRETLKDFIKQAREKVEKEKAQNQKDACSTQDCQQSLETHKPLVL